MYCVYTIYCVACRCGKIHVHFGCVMDVFLCSTLYSECCTAAGGWSYTIAGTVSIHSFMECSHC